jgi:hypothetical protein
MRLKKLDEDYCQSCEKLLTYEGQTFSRVIGVEYQGGYDGVSEWLCPDCGRREGRWTGKVLADDETEQAYGGR